MEGVHDGGCERGLARAGRASHHHDGLLPSVGEKAREDGEGVVLVLSGRKAEVADYALNELVGLHLNKEKFTLP